MLKLSYKLTSLVLVCVALSGCVSTQVMPLAPNMVRIDTRARGNLGVNQTVPATMKAAATATINAGYSHFKIQDPNLKQGDQYAGSSDFVSLSGSGYNASGWGSSSAEYRPIAAAAITVVMFNARDPQARNAFNAEQVLKQYSQK